MSANYDNEIMAMAETDDAARLNRLRAAAIAQRFAEIDKERIRPMSAVALGTETPTDITKLENLEAEAEQLRAELAQMNGG